MADRNKQRVIAYVDGFNLYFGLRDSNYRRYYWLNLQALAENLLRTYQRLIGTKYFTARIAGGTRQINEKRQRQNDFLEALETLNNFTIYYGHYLKKAVTCYNCRATWFTHEEKMTDVNIATELLTDAYEDRFDTALLISADSDLVPPVQAIRRLFPAKRIVACFPPGRFSEHLKQAAHGQLILGRAILAKSQFPDHIGKANGFVLQRPQTWR